jgi:serine/threonine-protein phosphatase 2A regulatory subunit A
MADNTNPFDVLKEDMESEETYLRVNAIHRLRIIVTLMSPEKIKTHLIPYFDCKSKDCSS